MSTCKGGLRDVIPVGSISNVGDYTGFYSLDGQLTLVI